MKRKLELFDGTKTYMFPNGALATPQVMAAQFPAVQSFPHVIETDEGGQVCYAVQNLSALKSLHGVARAASDAEAIAAIEAILNAPAPTRDTRPSAEERIAAALEFKNLLAMDGGTK